MSDSDLNPATRLVHFTPLRYPGGKAKLAAYVKSIIETNSLHDGEYVEPYAGGAGIALELLFQEYVSRIRINDISRPVNAFWRSVLNETDELCRLIRDTKRSVASWDRQKRIFAKQDDQDDLALGFATFFLNRTNRSGILNGGIIGGRDQTGAWKIDARYNAKELILRVESIAKLRARISLTKQDAVAFLRNGIERWPQKTLIYLDPPYFHKGSGLYYDYYDAKDHGRVAKFVHEKMNGRFWLVSYDNAAEIRKLYERYASVLYRIGYTARETRKGSEVMFFSNTLKIPPLVGPIRQLRAVKQGVAKAA